MQGKGRKIIWLSVINTVALAKNKKDDKKKAYSYRPNSCILQKKFAFSLASRLFIKLNNKRGWLPPGIGMIFKKIEGWSHQKLWNCQDDTDIAMGHMNPFIHQITDFLVTARQVSHWNWKWTSHRLIEKAFSFLNLLNSDFLANHFQLFTFA